MKDISKLPAIHNDELSRERDIQTVTAEIRTLNQQAGKMALSYAVEIGRRLVEAKELLGHGEWGSWLENEVEFSQSTANNFMRLFNEFGSQQIGLFGNISNSQAFGNLTYTKALKLLAIPEEEREEFALENDVENMSTRELQKAIAERDEAVKAREDAEAEKLEAERVKAELNKKLSEAIAQKDSLAQRERDLEAEIEVIKKQAAEPLTPDTKELNKARREAAKEAKEKAEKAAAKKVNDLENELERLQKEKAAAEEEARKAAETVKAAEGEVEKIRKQATVSANKGVIEYQVFFKSFQEDYHKMRKQIDAVAQEDADMAQKLKAATVKLISSWVEALSGD